MTTTTATATYRAQTDPTTKKWHLGTAERGAKSVCGVELITPEDTRAFALKVATDARHYETSDELERVTCGSCRRNREWGYAHGAARPADRQPASGTRSTTRRRRAPAATGDPRADRAVSEAATTGATAEAAAGTEAAADAAARPSATARKKRQSRADKAAAKTAADKARREALAADADATVAAIEAAVATVAPAAE